jgi:hypothetical protein
MQRSLVVLNPRSPALGIVHKGVGSMPAGKNMADSSHRRQPRAVELKPRDEVPQHPEILA